ncbi:acetyltransferase family protein, partial [Vibrio parahaemolyticus EKP-021]
MGKILILQICS